MVIRVVEREYLIIDKIVTNRKLAFTVRPCSHPVSKASRRFMLAMAFSGRRQ